MPAGGAASLRRRDTLGSDSTVIRHASRESISFWDSLQGSQGGASGAGDDDDERGSSKRSSTRSGAGGGGSGSGSGSLRPPPEFGRRGEEWVAAQFLLIFLLLFPPPIIGQSLQLLGMHAPSDGCPLLRLPGAGGGAQAPGPGAAPAPTPALAAAQVLLRLLIDAALGPLALLAGVGIILFGAKYLGPSLTPLPLPTQDATLVQTGAYAYVRHPLYVGLIMAALAMSKMTCSPARLFVSAVLAVVLNGKAAAEEKFLTARFGAEYLEYKKRVKRFVPGVY